MIPHNQYQCFSTSPFDEAAGENDELPSYLKVVKKTPEKPPEVDKDGKIEIDEKNPPKPVMRKSWNNCPCLKHGYFLIILYCLELSK